MVRFGKTAVSGPAAWAAVVIAALLTTLSVPRHEPFPYRYRQGAAWAYPTYKAPFDFDVLRPEAEMRDELAKVEAEHGPYFYLDPGVGKMQRKKLARLLDEQLDISRHDTQFDDLRANAGAYAAFGERMLDRLYSIGIADGEAVADLGLAPDTLVHLINGREERRLPLRSLLTIDQARLYLSDTLPYAPLRQPEQLLPLLEKTLVPNIFYSDSLTQSGKRRRIASLLSTGLSIHKGEVLVNRNEIVTEEIRQKLDSLAHQYETPYGPGVLAGQLVLALLAFGSMWFLNRTPNLLIRSTGWTTAAVLAVNLSYPVAAPMPLLVPIWVLPVLLQKELGERRALYTSAAVLFLSQLYLPWSAGWTAIQLSGALLALQLFTDRCTLSDRIRSVLLVSALQILVWQACVWAEKLPNALQTADVLLFLLAGNGLALGLCGFQNREGQQLRIEEKV